MNVDKNILNEKAELLKILGHPIRLCIVSGLIEYGKNNVSYIQKCLDLPQSTLSQHLAKLRMAHIIEYERKGTEIYYSIKNEEVINLIRALFNKNVNKQET
jgi:ArsR family transcriptional regulator